MPDASTEYEVLIVGGGLTGLYQLYRAREHGWSVRLLEAGGGVGGTWYWNRYPAARTDSEGYSYAYFMNEELLQSWDWKETFPAQPDLERYYNEFVDRFDLRRDIELNTRVTAAEYDEPSGRWTLRTATGQTFVTRYLVAASGVLSVPHFPDIPGAGEFAGPVHHTAQWPAEGVDVRGKRVAVIGTGSSGIQLIPAIVDEVASLTVYQRTANWAMPLNNKPLSPQEQEDIRRNYPALRELLRRTSGGFVHEDATRKTFEDSESERRAHYERLWNGQGMRAMFSTYADLVTDPAANAEFSRFLAEKIRSIVTDPVVAKKLIPSDHGFGMKRPPMENGYYEAFNRSHVELVDLRANPTRRITATGIESEDRPREFDVIVYATGFDAFTGALLKMGIRGRDGVSLNDTWADGPFTYLGVAVPGYPNLLIDSGPHGTYGNIPRSAEVQADFVTELVNHARAHGYERIEATTEAAEAWTAHVYEAAQYYLLADGAWYVGGNVPGKPRRFLPYSWGIPTYRSKLDEVVAAGYRGFEFATAAVPSPVASGA
ncbi:flavin-containing monooxygenase [Sporichthya polymorpha]|uniref:flavin-containing monooxygenase n=1 Tax=Sporichthya polymorpha TaxID=35751 RepID=UPI0003650089|nr:NAD(P)/FAD-dependent oxidoreductase [Sporichthya polymorpha]